MGDMCMAYSNSAWKAISMGEMCMANSNSAWKAISMGDMCMANSNSAWKAISMGDIYRVAPYDDKQPTSEAVCNACL